MSLIKVENLNFEYPKKRILKDINFEITEGSVTALVGPNGAGKTTLLRCLTSLEIPVSGNVTINGVDVHDSPREAHQYMGYLSDFFGVYDDLTVRQCLTYMAWCHKLPSENLKSHIEDVAEEVDIARYLDEKASNLSRGYKQRLGVGLALVHSPKCIFLDEPASGMDPESRIKFSELMIRLRNRGVTIIVSSHILAELEDYCTDMLVIREGEIKSHIILAEHQVIENIVIEIHLRKILKKHLEIIKKSDNVSEIKTSDNCVSVLFNGDKNQQESFLKNLINKNVPIYQFTPEQKTLKSAYMDLAEKKKVEAS